MLNVAGVGAVKAEMNYEVVTLNFDLFDSEMANVVRMVQSTVLVPEA